MANKKAQVTLFIILGLIIVILAGMFFMFLGDDIDEVEFEEITKLPLEMQPIALYVDACIEDVAVPGVYLLANQGGYIYSYPFSKVTELGEVAYHLYDGEELGPNVEEMEDQLKRFIESTLVLCVRDFENLSVLNVEFGEINAKPIITENNVLVEVDYPITLTISNKKRTVESFRKEIPIRLGHILDIKEDLIKDISIQGGFIELESLTEYDLEISILPVDSSNMIYSLYDNFSDIDNNEFVFNFAVREEYIENKVPEVNDFEPQYAYVDELFTFNILASDPEGVALTYKDTTVLFDVDSSGKIEFTPTPGDVGNYSIMILINDGENEVIQDINLTITER